MLLKHFFTVTIAATLVLLVDPARAQNAHGSIAVGQTTSGESVAYGFAWNYIARDEAREAALNACRVGGGTGCVELAWFRNGCGALAVDQYGSAQAKSAITQDQAQERAVRTCEASGGSGCAVVGSQCARPGEDAGTWSGSEHVLAAPERDADGRRAEPQTEVLKARDEALTREERIKVQSGLAAVGFDAGPADGIFGPRTRSAIWDWQTAKGQEATGYLTREEAEALGALGQTDELYYEGSDSEGVESEQPSVASEPEPSDSQNVVLHFPQCSDLDELEPDVLGCWKEIANRRGCDVFLPIVTPDELNVVSKTQVTWSGSCQHNAARGQGSLEYVMGEKVVSESGRIVEGKMHGRWVRRGRLSNGAELIYEGPYVDGVRHGRWLERLTLNNDIEDTMEKEGPYVDGLRHGRWVVRYQHSPDVEWIEVWKCHYALALTFLDDSDDCEREE